VIPIDSRLQKTLLLLTLTTLTIGLGASLSWVSPGSDANVQSGVTLNVSKDSDVDWVNFDINGPTNTENNQSGISGDDYASITFSPDSTNSGDYTITAETNSSSEDRDITIDGDTPTFNNIPSYASETFSITVQDDTTGIQNVSATAADSSILDESESKDGCTDCDVEFEFDTDNVNTGDEVDIDFTAYDQVGNQGTSGTKTITFDNSYDGDTSPDISLEDYDDDTILVDENDDVTVEVDISEEDETSDIRAKCMVNDEEVETTDYENPDDDSTEFSCDVPVDEYSGTIDFEVELCDKAGNCADTDSEEFVFDLLPPTVEDVEQPNGISTFNSDFQLSYTAYDADGSGISQLEYFFYEDTDYDSGTEVDLDGDSRFTVDPSDENSGSQTVYIRAQDGAGRWSDTVSFDFDYYPDREPDISLSAPESMEITHGESESFTLTVKNTGEFFIKSAEITASEFLSSSILITDLSQDSSVQKTVDLNTSDHEVGVYNLTLNSEEYGVSSTMEVTVRATQEQEQEINQSLQNWTDKKQELEQNVSEIGTLDMSNENITKFTQTVENAQEAVQSGEHYRAKSYLENVESEFESAQSTYSEGLQKHQKNMRNRMFMFALVGIVILGGGAAGFFLYREESINAEEMPNLPTGGLAPELPDNLPELGVMEKIRELTGEEEEEEQVGYTFEDFT
jgi:hypothetical protein